MHFFKSLSFVLAFGIFLFLHFHEVESGEPNNSAGYALSNRRVVNALARAVLSPSRSTAMAGLLIEKLFCSIRKKDSKELYTLIRKY